MFWLATEARVRPKTATSLPKAADLAGMGTVCAQWVRCGSPRCHCARGTLHGPYFALLWREAGRLRKCYVPLADVPAAAAACAARRAREKRERRRARTGWDEWRALRDLLREVERDG
jgi:hypothetical protein